MKFYRFLHFFPFSVLYGIVKFVCQITLKKFDKSVTKYEIMPQTSTNYRDGEKDKMHIYVSFSGQQFLTHFSLLI
jgi:hypothetical protein